VREELEISKEAVQDTEHVTGTVRREEARVEGDVDDVDRPVR
jgi:stress response protein YsnF